MRHLTFFTILVISISTGRVMANCQQFDTKDAQTKRREIFSKHETMIRITAKQFSWQQRAKIMKGANEFSEEYIEKFLNGDYEYNNLDRTLSATARTTQFLLPSNKAGSLGYKTLATAFDNDCEEHPLKKVKKVHALGSLAKAEFKSYSEIIKLNLKNKPTNETSPNPFTGVFSDHRVAVPMLLRFSIANPLLGEIKIPGVNRFTLEFIPGLGMKFFIDGKRSLDLVAMESLAGQGGDHNYFKYSFSHDFSRKAPMHFNVTLPGTSEYKRIKSRYNYNITNSLVMGWVGKKFAKLIPEVSSNSAAAVEKSRNNGEGPHPFVMSIGHLARTLPNGVIVNDSDVKRPYRVIFQPALDNVPAKRLKEITSSDPVRIFDFFNRYKNDFRYKLSNLNSGDRLYYVVAQNKSGEKYRIGEITLSSSALPSEYQDKLYFAQHALDEDRFKRPELILGPKDFD